MRRLFAVTLLALCAHRAAAQARQDTLPERVAQRTYEAFQRHDLDATYANYDTVFTYERFGDPAGAHQLRRDDYLRQMKADTAVVRIIRGQRITLVRTDVFGAFVNQEWRERFADGREFKHFELLEVRGGKIVREIEGDRLLNPWNPQQSNTTASLHGLSIVNANVVWASGTGGTFVRTTDGGATWRAGTVPGGEQLDFRDVYAVDATTAYLMSIGNGNESRIYKTTDTGKTWSLQYSEQNPKAFLDCMAFWNATQGIVVGDAVDGQAELLTTSDGGAHWTPLRPESLPRALDGEGSPASGTCIATYETRHAWFVTENASRVFRTADAGKTWAVSEAPLVTGLNQGVFSIAVVDAERLAIVGGDYDHPQMVKPNSAYTDDGGRTWKESSRRPAGYRWCVAIVPDTPGPTAFAVGPTGMDYSIDRGKNWDRISDVDANTIGFADAHHGWAVGRKGLILKFEGTVPGGT